MQRFDIPIRGAAVGAIAISSRRSTADGCQPLYADLFLQTGNAWRRVFAADDAGMPYGALLPAPQGTEGGCSPQLRLFAPQAGTDGSSAYLLIGAAYADTSIRLLVLGWDEAGTLPAALFDWRTGPHGRIDRSLSGDRIDVSEDVLAQTGETETSVVGRFVQSLVLADGGVTVTARRLAPNCDRGRVGAIDQLDGGRSRVTLSCSSGAAVVAVADDGTRLEPDGVGWGDIHAGDTLQLSFDPASLAPLSLADALPVAVSVTDNAAGTRHAAQLRTPRPTAASTRASTGAPVARATQASRPAQGSAPSRAVAPAQPLAPASAAPAETQAPPARQQQPPVRVAPAQAAPQPVVSPPPPPRGLPGSNPPPAPR